MKVVSAAQMREMDRQTSEEYGVPSIVLMENAALRVIETLTDRFGPLSGKRIAVVCGKGNNGGDGLAIARHLTVRLGAKVTIWMAAEPTERIGDAATNYQMAKAFGLDIRQISNATEDLKPGTSDFVIDALLGTGLHGAAREPQATIIEAMNQVGCLVVAVDVPSGLDADTGNVDGVCVRAALTVTFALPKFGLLVYPGAEYAGEVVVGDIAMPRPVMAASASQVWYTESADITRWLPSRIEGRDANKGKFGHVTVVTGSLGFIGAAVLSAEAAARAGAGLVTLLVPEGAQSSVVSRISPVVMTKGLPQTAQGTFSKSALETALAQAEKGNAAAIGPGIGAENEETQGFVREFIRQCPVPLVVDADALNVLASLPDRGASLMKARSEKYETVLTPHPGEMGRLVSRRTSEVQAMRRDSAESVAHDYACVALLKGARTLVAAPDGRLWINTTSNAGMATGGAGDALTGTIAALLAQGLKAAEAAAAGAYIHGLAGDLATDHLGGKAGLIATDIIEFLPQAIGRCQDTR